MSGTTIIGFIPILIFLAIYILLIFVLIKLIKWNPKQTDTSEVEKITIELEQLRIESAEKLQVLTGQLKEAKNRMASIEKILQEVE